MNFITQFIGFYASLHKGFMPIDDSSCSMFIDGNLPAADSLIDTYCGLFFSWFSAGNISDEDFPRI